MISESDVIWPSGGKDESFDLRLFSSDKHDRIDRKICFLDGIFFLSYLHIFLDFSFFFFLGHFSTVWTTIFTSLAAEPHSSSTERSVACETSER